jgi:peptidyl-prolyl cis-trans isomerase B (cyclophilin B)
MSQTVRLQTNLGNIDISLDDIKAPISVDNFKRYVESGFYTDTIFHRVIKDFMIQGGGMGDDMGRKDTFASIKNEANNGLKNKRGTIAMARTQDPHSASSQFFINLKDNAFLDFKSETHNGWGYCVFGEVVAGMDIVDQIGAVATTQRMGHSDVPREPIVLEKAFLVKMK